MLFMVESKISTTSDQILIASHESPDNGTQGGGGSSIVKVPGGLRPARL